MHHIFRFIQLALAAVFCLGAVGCSMLGFGSDESNGGGLDNALTSSLAALTKDDGRTNQNVNARSVYGETGVVLYDPLGDGSDFVLDPSGRIVKSDVDAAEAGQEINDLERRFFLANKHLTDGESLFYSGLYEEALVEINAALELTPRSAKAYAMKGSAEYKLGNVERAKAAWMVALKIDPNLKSVRRVLYLLQ